MKLNRITFTGADDGVAPDDLLSISHKYPFVEWGFLRSIKNEGTDRYPTAVWMSYFLNAVGGETVNYAIHLCGWLANRALKGHLVENWGSQRIQLNGFSAVESYTLPEVPHMEWILQCNTEKAVGMAYTRVHNRYNHHKISALWDRSGGMGTPESVWPDPNDCLPRGYAGGITPESLRDTLKTLSAKSDFIIGPKGYWVDMESGIRTDKRFDLEKVMRCIEIAEPFIGWEP